MPVAVQLRTTVRDTRTGDAVRVSDGSLRVVEHVVHKKRFSHVHFFGVARPFICEPVQPMLVTRLRDTPEEAAAKEIQRRHGLLVELLRRLERSDLEHAQALLRAVEAAGANALERLHVLNEWLATLQTKQALEHDREATELLDGWRQLAVKGVDSS